MIGRFLEKDRLRKLFVYLFGKDIPGRGIYVFPDDTFIVSYPRSGNTWTRFLIANLLHPNETVTFSNIDRFIPDITAVPRKMLRETPRPRVIKSHEYFDLRYNKTLYIVRDPRDVAVSCYYFHLKLRLIPPDCPLDEYIPRFMAGEFDTYGSWGQNVGTWVAARQHSEGFLLLRYEDMTADPIGELAKVADFFGIPPDRDRLSGAVELSSADRMRKLESSESEVWVVTKPTRKDIPFVRDAKAGGWKNHLSPRSIAAIETAWGSLMKHLNYETSIPAESFSPFAFAEPKARL